MKYFCVLVLPLLHYVQCVTSADGDYNRLPELYTLDDFDSCLRTRSSDHPGVYCLVKSVIKPIQSSEIWNLIEKYSENPKYNFRHDILERGVCLEVCRNKLLTISEFERNETFYQAEFNIGQQIALLPELFRDTMKHREDYSEILNRCVNIELMNKYNLSVYSEIEFCLASDDVIPWDNFDFVFIIVSVVILLLILFSTIYDISANVRWMDRYSSQLPETTRMMFNCFSIPRNWRSLTAAEKTPLMKTLQFIHCQRFMMNSWMILFHCSLIYCILPVSNPHIVEENHANGLTPAIDIIRFFFVLSSILMTILFLDEMENKKPELDFRYLWRGMVDRYVRIVPVYAFKILFTMTTLSWRFGDGPIWHKISMVEYGNCHKNWWTNLLFINNYVNISEPCIAEGWYLAADFQLFFFARLVRMLIWKFPKLTKILLGGGLILAYVCVGWKTYYDELDGALVIPLQTIHSIRNFQVIDKNLEGHLHSHMHFGNTLIGILGGMIFYKLWQQNFSLRKYKAFNILWHLTIPILCGFICFAKIFFYNDFEKPSLWMALCAAIYRHAWAWLFCLLFFGLAFQINPIISKFHNHSVFRIMGKISFSVYLFHFIAMKSIATMREPAFINIFSFLLYYGKTLVTSGIAGFIICLCIELPTGALYRHYKNRKCLPNKNE